MAEVQRANQQTRHDLVAHTEHQGRIKGVMAQRHGSGHGDRIAAEQAQFHAGHALGHAIAHRWGATCNLCRRTTLAGFVFQNVRVVLKRRMGRQHIVVSRHDGHIGCALCHHTQLVIAGQGGKCVCHIGTAHALCAGVRCAMACTCAR